MSQPFVDLYVLLFILGFNRNPSRKEDLMATAYKTPVEEQKVLKAKPRLVDREALRADINARYENTLRYLGR